MTHLHQHPRPPRLVAAAALTLALSLLGACAGQHKPAGDAATDAARNPAETPPNTDHLRFAELAPPTVEGWAVPEPAPPREGAPASWYVPMQGKIDRALRVTVHAEAADHVRSIQVEFALAASGGSTPGEHDGAEPAHRTAARGDGAPPTAAELARLAADAPGRPVREDLTTIGMGLYGRTAFDAAIDTPGENARSIFDPPLPALPGGLMPGQTIELEGAMKVVSLENPSKQRERGRTRYVVRHAGVQEIMTPAGRRQAVRIESEFRADLGAAKVSTDAVRWYGPDLTLLAERKRETVRALMLTVRRVDEAWVWAGDEPGGIDGRPAPTAPQPSAGR